MEREKGNVNPKKGVITDVSQALPHNPIVNLMGTTCFHYYSSMMKAHINTGTFIKGHKGVLSSAAYNYLNHCRQIATSIYGSQTQFIAPGQGSSGVPHSPYSHNGVHPEGKHTHDSQDTVIKTQESQYIHFMFCKVCLSETCLSFVVQNKL
jgi:hypothetical protein